jgi:hypothetical protein
MSVAVRISGNSLDSNCTQVSGEILKFEIFITFISACSNATILRVDFSLVTTGDMDVLYFSSWTLWPGNHVEKWRVQDTNWRKSISYTGHES